MIPANNEFIGDLENIIFDGEEEEDEEEGSDNSNDDNNNENEKGFDDFIEFEKGYNVKLSHYARMILSNPKSRFQRYKRPESDIYFSNNKSIENNFILRYSKYEYNPTAYTYGGQDVFWALNEMRKLDLSCVDFMKIARIYLNKAEFIISSKFPYKNVNLLNFKYVALNYSHKIINLKTSSNYLVLYFMLPKYRQYIIPSTGDTLLVKFINSILLTDTYGTCEETERIRMLYDINKITDDFVQSFSKLKDSANTFYSKAKILFIFRTFIELCFNYRDSKNITTLFNLRYSLSYYLVDIFLLLMQYEWYNLSDTGQTAYEYWKERIDKKEIYQSQKEFVKVKNFFTYEDNNDVYKNFRNEENSKYSDLFFDNEIYTKLKDNNLEKILNKKDDDKNIGYKASIYLCLGFMKNFWCSCGEQLIKDGKVIVGADHLIKAHGVKNLILCTCGEYIRTDDKTHYKAKHGKTKCSICGKIDEKWKVRQYMCCKPTVLCTCGKNILASKIKNHLLNNHRI